MSASMPPVWYSAESEEWFVADPRSTFDGHFRLVAAGPPLDVLPEGAVRLVPVQDELEEHFLDANERMGEALTAIGMALGLPRPGVDATWGAPEILARVQAWRDQMAKDEKDAGDRQWAMADGYENDLAAARKERDALTREVEQLRAALSRVADTLDGADSAYDYVTAELDTDIIRLSIVNPDDLDTSTADLKTAVRALLGAAVSTDNTDDIGWSCRDCGCSRRECDAHRREHPRPRKCCPDCDHRADLDAIYASGTDASTRLAEESRALFRPAGPTPEDIAAHSPAAAPDGFPGGPWEARDSRIIDAAGNELFLFRTADARWRQDVYATWLVAVVNHAMAAVSTPPDGSRSRLVDVEVQRVRAVLVILRDQFETHTQQHQCVASALYGLDHIGALTGSGAPQPPTATPEPPTAGPHALDIIAARQIDATGNVVSGLGHHGLATRLWALAADLRAARIDIRKES